MDEWIRRDRRTAPAGRYYLVLLDVVVGFATPELELFFVVSGEPA